jgi:hypothetical protein
MVRKTVCSALYYMSAKIVKAANKRLLKVDPSAISDFKKWLKKIIKLLYVFPILVYIIPEKNND